MGGIRTILIDFGGVLAEEGFREGLREIGRRTGHDPDRFFHAVERIIAETGYLTGKTGEALFWETVRNKTGVTESDEAMRGEILTRFVVRQDMLVWVDRTRTAGLRIAIVSDQTNWLEEIDAATGLYDHFDAVFNSFRFGKSKADASIFVDICANLESAPDATLFVDDDHGHIDRAASRGLQTLLFTGPDDFLRRVDHLLGTALPPEHH